MKREVLNAAAEFAESAELGRMLTRSVRATRLVRLASGQNRKFSGGPGISPVDLHCMIEFRAFRHRCAGHSVGVTPG
ncbi:hypothetical protein QCE63_05795 [Caballeronia sp. LZ065]|uniref:hypothetical protein n=1 Tax=Caballeronia sp. LZ065 TaxID=3038571 RepID=UPI002863F770|nr:hypothetical protein [Caballeronia sp. LZ065]MDR5778941.1 hypothetical protein [Caballeronia sp. LZ065]